MAGLFDDFPTSQKSQIVVQMCFLLQEKVAGLGPGLVLFWPESESLTFRVRVRVRVIVFRVRVRVQVLGNWTRDRSRDRDRPRVLQH